ncbi:hypothetical protein [[Mycoplasma] cavipharyngis]|uniref:hypothetical protein n=1 Tax=[Mycoplasma] cavipharyngis TaxID=92757 RepID=UPI0037041818
MPLVNSIRNDLIFINPNNLEVYDPSLEISYDMRSFRCVYIFTDRCKTDRCKKVSDTK